MSATPIDLSRLPSPDVVEALDYETLFAQRKAELVALFPAAQQPEIATTLTLESEPLTKALQSSTYRELVLRQRVNDAARAVMLAKAMGADLEHLAALFGIARLTITPADPENDMPAVMERDEDLRKRTQLAPQGFSVAGPEGAYKSHALGADGRVLDASATSPTPGTVVVTVLSRDGDGTADAALLAAVESVLGADDVRPLTDHVLVRSAEIVTYRARARLYTFPGPDSTVVIEEARKRLLAYNAAIHRLGMEPTLSGIYAALHIDGVERVELLEPTASIPVTRTQAPYCILVDIQHGGVYG
ncbi:baseplate J/gp47 family protein [Cupriavidus sp. NPDC089707]|uniref:baseplate assembly protein n=1 Tax=Cupriavidus sp. NPDC089707 TaxID=3363963 RepID=UPI0037FD52B2